MAVWPDAEDEARAFDGREPAAQRLRLPRRLRLAQIIGAERVFIYAMAQEPWLTFISSLEYDESSFAMQEARKMIAACRQAGVDASLLNGCIDIPLQAG